MYIIKHATKHQPCLINHCAQCWSSLASRCRPCTYKPCNCRQCPPRPMPRLLLFRFYKADKDTGARLPGAVFELRSANGMVSSNVSDRMGLVKFEIMPCTQYVLTEITPPIGYQPIVTSFRIYMDTCARLFVNGQYTARFVVSDAAIPTITKTVTGTVSPFVYNDRGFGTEFLENFNIEVELRTTFDAPAPDNLRTIAVAVEDTGLGEFTISNVPLGHYVLYIKRPGYLARSMLITVSDSSPSTIVLTPPDGEVFVLWAGDVNDDGIVDATDLSIVYDHFGETWQDSNYMAATDMNADGFIDGRDGSIVRENSNLTVRDYPGADTVPF